ncbi:ferrous iron transport protein A [Sporanaerobium hydrogeniformans]|uniref:Ferrous iron transport protein A n=1 Tax=Sporanaerobium hydrogeniformans TaxID=3072179 RepID=A0AC61DC95_9FIRM|nr:FeoA family protein [Sporanaerobium hydrogeniformans]PHV70899.1 ferrous iron transport protein A [Sporanaerobium hydrogeniformans]
MQTSLFSLNQLAIGQKAQIVNVEALGPLMPRMLDLGAINGTPIEALHRSPTGDPTAYFIRGTVIALRQEDAQKIVIQSFLP